MNVQIVLLHLGRSGSRYSMPRLSAILAILRVAVVHANAPSVRAFLLVKPLKSESQPLAVDRKPDPPPIVHFTAISPASRMRLASQANVGAEHLKCNPIPPLRLLAWIGQPSDACQHSTHCPTAKELFKAIDSTEPDMGPVCLLLTHSGQNVIPRGSSSANAPQRGNFQF